MVAFVLSAVFAGLAGGTFTLFQSFINPDSVGLAQLILVLTMVVVGGSGSIAGVLVGELLIGMLMPRGLWGVAKTFFARTPKSAPTAAKARQPTS